MHPIKLAVLLALLYSAGSAMAEQPSCNLPEKIPAPKTLKADCVNQTKPDSFALALSWSPQHCANANADKHSFQCSQNRFGFVVHGLWPQNSQARNKCDHPRNCDSSLVDNATLQKTLCTVPGVELIQAQWQKHGSCSGLTAPAYFDKTRELFQALVKPDLPSLLNPEGYVSAGEIIAAFVKANQKLGLPREAIAVQVAKKNEFSEVFICYDLNYRFTACTTSRTPDKQRVHVTLP